MYQSLTPARGNDRGHEPTQRPCMFGTRWGETAFSLGAGWVGLYRCGRFSSNLTLGRGLLELASSEDIALDLDGSLIAERNLGGGTADIVVALPRDVAGRGAGSWRSGLTGRDGRRREIESFSSSCTEGALLVLVDLIRRRRVDELSESELSSRSSCLNRSFSSSLSASVRVSLSGLLVRGWAGGAAGGAEAGGAGAGGAGAGATCGCLPREVERVSEALDS